MVSEMKISRKRKCREDEDVGDMSLGEFMQKGLGSGSDEETAPKKEQKCKKVTRISKKKTPQNGTSKKLKFEEPKIKQKDKREKAPKKTALAAEKTSAKKLKSKKAPEAVQPASESENESESEAEFIDDIDDVQSDDEVIARPRLEAASEDVDADEDELNGIELSDEDDDEILDENVQILTEKSLRHLLAQMKSKPDTNQVKRLTQMFTGAVSEAAGDRAKTKFSVRGQGLFNAVVLACLQDLLPAVHKVMKLPPPVVPKDGSKMIDPTKGHCWKKIKNPMSLYMIDLLKLLGCITQQKLQLSLLRHLLLLLPFVRARPQVEKKVLKCLSRLWSTGEESVRVVSFLCLIRLIRGGDDAVFQDVLKQMYLAYVANCKFTSPQTWPLISFMRRSLVEAYALRPSIAYQHSFLYIRQLAITLRTAMTVKKKDSHKAVYNWQFVHSTLLWCHLLATVRTKAMEPLIYPVVQVVTGLLNLIPSEKYIPLRLHVIRGIIELSTETTTFIPILPMLVSTLKLVRWDQKPKVVSMKPMNLSCALRVSDKQVKESAFRDAVIESFQEMALGYLAGISHLLSFPEVVVASCIELKKIKLKVIKHQTTIKQLLEKMNENSKFIESTREQAGLAIKELEKVAALELQLRGTTPFCAYLEKFEKLREKKLHEANEDVLENYDSDEDKKAKKKSKKATKGEGDGSDEEEEKPADEDMETEADNSASDPRGIGKLDSDLDTDEEGDDEVGFEVADDDEDDDDDDDDDDE